MFGPRKGTTPRKRRSLLSCRPSLPAARRPVNAALTPNPSKSSIRVILRVRPPTEKELADIRNRDVIDVVDKDVVIFDPKEEEDPFHLHGQRQKFRDINKKVRKHLQFSFDHVFGPEDATLEVYSTSIHGMITHLLGGYNCTVFAYGATGAGKTHTMLGNTERPGVTPLLMSSLYAALDEVESAEVDISVSYLEIYNETVNDLLVDQTSVKPLNLREDGDSVIVSDLSWHRPATALDLMAMLQLGNQRRTQHPTDANAESSRSHAVFQVLVKIKRAGQMRCAKLSMIDLAGSERASATTNSQLRFTEGANINKSLLALGNCINALADGLKHVPFRNSKLTRLLKGSLGGNCQTVMIANVSPSSIVYEDTYNTLKYATRAKKIKNKVKKNTASLDITPLEFTRAMERAQEEINKLREENQQLKEQVAAGETARMQLAAERQNLQDQLQAALQTTQTAVGSECLVNQDELEDLRRQLASAQEELQALRQQPAVVVPPVDVTPSPPMSPAGNSILDILCDLAIATRRLTAAMDQRHTVLSQLLSLEYNFEKKRQRIERFNELKKDATQTKVTALELKTQSQRRSLEERLRRADTTVSSEQLSWSEVHTELLRELGALPVYGQELAAAITRPLRSDVELIEERLKLQSVQMLDNLKQTDLLSLHKQYMMTASLLHKAFYVLKGHNTLSPEMEAHFEQILSVVKQPSHVTFNMNEDDQEVLAEPLNATFVAENLNGTYVAETPNGLNGTFVADSLNATYVAEPPKESHVTGILKNNVCTTKPPPGPSYVPKKTSYADALNGTFVTESLNSTYVAAPLETTFSIPTPAVPARRTSPRGSSKNSPATLPANVPTRRVSPRTTRSPLEVMGPPLPSVNKLSRKVSPRSHMASLAALAKKPKMAGTPIHPVRPQQSSMGPPATPQSSYRTMTSSAARRKRTPIRNQYKKFKRSSIVLNKENRI